MNHELARYGDRSKISERLDVEMSEHVEILGPFRFTATMLVYDSGLEFQLIPYDQIISARAEPGDGDDNTPAIVVHTRKGRRHQWYRTWMQGIFEPDKTLAKIRTAAHLDDPGSPLPSVSSVV